MIWSSSPGDDHVAPPVLGHGLAFCVTRARGLLALTPETGEEVWRLETERGWGSCQLGHGFLFSTPRPGVLLALDPTRGSVVESFSVADLSLRYGVVVDQRIVSPLEPGVLGAWDLRSRELAWRVPNNGWRVSSLTAADGLVLLAVQGAYVALDFATGMERWRFDVTERGRHKTIMDGERAGTTAGVPIVALGFVCCGVSGGSLCALDLATGALRWQLGVGGLSPRNYAFAANGILVFLSDDALFEIDVTSGAVRSRHELRCPPGIDLRSPFAPIAVAAELVWTTDRKGRLVAIGRADGAVSIRGEGIGGMGDAPVLGEDKVFVAGLDGQLRVFGAVLER
jgi:outer membrane protein assembly factor BamB